MTTTEHQRAPRDGSVPAGEPTRRADVVVVGGGLAGLTAAAVAHRDGRSVVVVPGPAPDGRAATDERAGFLLNRGPHALYRAGAGAGVLDRLGIRPDGVGPPSTGVLLRDGTPVPIPSGLWQLVRSPLLGSWEKFRVGAFLARVARADPADVADRTIDQWLRAELPEGAVPLVAMVVRVASYAADTTTVSADVAALQLKASTRGVQYLHGGWATLARSLCAAAPAVTTLPGRVRSVRSDGAGVLVDTSAGRIAAGAVVVAAGSPEACADLLPSARWGPTGPAVTASVLDLGLRRPPTHEVVLGVDEPLYLIAHAPTARLAPPGSALVHAMRNHVGEEDVDPRTVRARLEALARTAGIAEDDVVVARYLHRMPVVTAAPTPALGGLGGRPSVATGLPGVFVAGDWVGPTGFLADASLASGESAGSLAAAHAADLTRAARGAAVAR